MLRRVDVGRPQIGRQQVGAAEHIERQEAVAVVVAVEEAPLPVAVHLHASVASMSSTISSGGCAKEAMKVSTRTA